MEPSRTRKKRKAEPSTSDSSDKGKRKSAPQGRCDSNEPLSEVNKHSSVKDIMRSVYEKLKEEDQPSIQPFIDFLKTTIDELDVNRRELVGVFGRTGAGKSSLINAIIGESNLLPSGSVQACTSVMIKVEANTKNSEEYEAEIEFITPEEWNKEVMHLSFILKEDQEDNDNEQRLSAVYGKEWRNIKNFMDKKYFKEIPEFLRNLCKSLTCKSPKDLSEKLVQYTRSESKKERRNQWYWPLVKCVTVKVPDTPLLQHVTLVDLPGCGDRNKSRDKMWKELVGKCSTVWIVTEINRAASDKETWEILKHACGLIGNGGQCQRIHFICTKSDIHDESDESDESDDLSTGAAHILERNEETKEKVQKAFLEQSNIKKHFSNDCLEVFTVSAKAFLRRKRSKPTILQEKETEIPKLQDLLKNLNDHHSETLNHMYVSEAHGFLSLMQGARSRDTADSKAHVCSQLEGMLSHKLIEIQRSMVNIYVTFEKQLTEGVRESEESCEEILQSFLDPEDLPKGGGSGFHKTLKCVVENYGVHTKKPMNLNEMLSSYLTDSIDEEFRETFPNEEKHAPLKGIINDFSLNTDKLIKKYKDIELLLIFLQTEVKQIKTKLHEIIRDRKKTVYRSLTETVQEAMEEGYEEAAEIRGKGSMNKMKETLMKHVHDSKDTMFNKAKDVMLQKMENLMEEIRVMLKETLNKSIALSLKTDHHFIPDFSAELELVKQHYKGLEERTNEGM